MIDGFVFEYVGLKSYGEVLELQEAYFNQLLEEKKEHGLSTSPSKMFLCQHKPVYTLGKNGEESNLLPQGSPPNFTNFQSSQKLYATLWYLSCQQKGSVIDFYESDFILSEGEKE